MASPGLGRYINIPFLIFMVMLVHGKAFAQPYVDLFNARFQHFSGQAYKNNPGNNLLSNHYEVSMLLPKVLKNKNVLMLSVCYRQTDFIARMTNKKRTSLYSISLQPAFDYKWGNSKWGSFLRIISRINSDLKKAGSDNYQLGGVALVSYKKSDNVKFRAGLYYNREFFGNYFVPLFGVDWRVNKRINLYGIIPNNFNVEYMFTGNLYAGLTVLSSVGSYRVHGLVNEAYVREGEESTGHYQVKFFAEFYSRKRVVIFAEGGLMFNRIYILYDKFNRTLNIPESVFQKADDGFFISAGLAYRIRRNP